MGALLVKQKYLSGFCCCSELLYTQIVEESDAILNFIGYIRE